MKVVLGTIAAVMVLTAAAFAQTDSSTTAPPAVAAASRCAAIAAEPTPPDGATAEADAVAAFDTSYQTWANATRESLICRRAEVQQVEAQARALTEEHNAGAARLNAVTQSWTTERDEYCARRGIRCTERTAN